MPQVNSQVVDSFRSAPESIKSQDQMAQGRPVLPALTYDITLPPNPAIPGISIPIPRGVRLLSAKSQPNLDNYNPHVTTPVTDQAYLQRQENPTMTARATWLPDLPYAIQRTARRTASGGDILTDQLVISPAQFSASNSETGQLRRFTEMVFEVTYVEPQIAPTAVLAQVSSPLFSDVRITPLSVPGALATQAVEPSVRFSAIVSDSNGSGLHEVSATYTDDGLTWQRQQLVLNANNRRYEATLPAPAAGGNVSAFFESLDNAGNVTVETHSGAVPESNEGNNRAELHGLVVTGPNPKSLSLRSVEQLPVRPVGR